MQGTARRGHRERASACLFRIVGLEVGPLTGLIERGADLAKVATADGLLEVGQVSVHLSQAQNFATAWTFDPVRVRSLDSCTCWNVALVPL